MFLYCSYIAAWVLEASSHSNATQSWYVCRHVQRMCTSFARTCCVLQAAVQECAAVSRHVRTQVQDLCEMGSQIPAK